MNALRKAVGLVPVAAPTYRLAPGTLFWLAIAVAAGFGLVALWLAWRWYLVVRPRRVHERVVSGKSNVTNCANGDVR